MLSRSLTGMGRLLALVVAVWAAGAGAQTPIAGMIIRVAEPPLVYIDLGARDGVHEGDLFDIVESEVVSNPLSGDTLGVSPRRVGSIRVRQVHEKVSIAELVSLDKGEDPMLMKVARIEDPGRRALVQEQARAVRPVDAGPSLRLGLVPGLYQVRTGHAGRGGSYMAAEVGALAAAIAYRVSSLDWEKRYDEYGSDPEDTNTGYLVTLGKGMQDRRRWSNRLFWTAGAVYALNWIDVLWSDGRAASGLPFVLGAGVDGNGHTLVQASWAF
ncbi:MAG: FlgT C-terminal domain-containing protein [Candidatus Latescibacterota bacterium]